MTDENDLAQYIAHWNLDYIMNGKLVKMKNSFPTNHVDIYEVKSALGQDFAINVCYSKFTAR